MGSFYGKINTLYKRDMTRKGSPIIIGDYCIPEIEALANVKWEATEKIDGTNMSCEFIPSEGRLTIRGKTENANIPSHLFAKMNELFTCNKLRIIFAKTDANGDCVYPDKVEIFGEGYGLKIQKGHNYIPDHCDFILFDVRVTTGGKSLWLTREACENIASLLGIDIVPIIGHFTIQEACDLVKKGFLSTIAHNKEYIAEGLVLRAPFGILDRRGNRIITKIKHCDFRGLE